MASSIKKSSVTVNDIAKALKISPSTVSRALNDNKRISERTRDLVVKKAIELGYGQGIVSVSKSLSSIKNVAVVLPALNSSIYTEAIEAIQDVANSVHINVLVSITQNSEKVEKQVLKNLYSLGVDGVIISHVYADSNTEIINKLLSDNIPVVDFVSVSNSDLTSKVVIDSYQGAYDAVEHLVAIGSSKISMLLGNPENVFYAGIVQGYKAAIEKLNVDYDDSLVIHSSLSASDISSSLAVLFQTGEVPNAIIVSDNYVALHVLSYLKRVGYSVPNDVAVVCFGNEMYNSLLSPSLSSVRFSAYNLGKKAINQILYKFDNKSAMSRTIIEPVTFVISGSSMLY